VLRLGHPARSFADSVAHVQPVSAQTEPEGPGNVGETSDGIRKIVFPDPPLATAYVPYSAGRPRRGGDGRYRGLRGWERRRRRRNDLRGRRRPGRTTATTTTAPTERTATSAESTTESQMAASQETVVRVRVHDELGEILVDSDGTTLYMFDGDAQGESASACTGDCVDAWPPLTVEDTLAAAVRVSDRRGRLRRGLGVPRGAYGPRRGTGGRGSDHGPVTRRWEDCRSRR
jgi:predicted lipoprotein with Yx(FWY)xxD motif